MQCSALKNFKKKQETKEKAELKKKRLSQQGLYKLKHIDIALKSMKRKTLLFSWGYRASA